MDKELKKQITLRAKLAYTISKNGAAIAMDFLGKALATGVTLFYIAYSI